MLVNDLEYVIIPLTKFGSVGDNAFTHVQDFYSN